MDRDPGSGRKMINQYLVLNEIGHGTHGRVRLGQDLSAEEAGPDYYVSADRNTSLMSGDKNRRSEPKTQASNGSCTPESKQCWQARQ